jgi:hypothetical protein
LSESSDTGITPSAQTVQRSAAYRFLLAAVILLGVLIVIALGVLVVGLTMRLGGHHTHQADSTPAQFTLAAGARVISTDVSGDRLVLRLKGSFGDEIDIIDMQTGRLVAKLRSAPPPKKQ